jgi:hypothetical protein
LKRREKLILIFVGGKKKLSAYFIDAIKDPSVTPNRLERRPFPAEIVQASIQDSQEQAFG